MKLYVGGYEIELDSKVKIAQTKQANDLTSLNTRQANYTNRFKIPMTAKNKIAFNLLGVTNNTSLTPYVRSETYLYGESGECFIYNGFSVITSTDGRGYSLNTYDGNINIYKAIENLSLSSLDLSEIAHTKDLTTVVDSFTNNNYKYIIADYNGKALYDTDKINIDYLVPSVNVKYLWDKIFNTFGYTYTGSVFQTFDFTNLWMTFPKGTLSTVPDVLLYETDDCKFIDNGSLVDDYVTDKKTTYFENIVSTTNDLQQVFENKHFKIFEAGNYRIEMSGTIKTYARVQFINSTSLAPVKCDIWLGKNSEGVSNSEDVVLIERLKADICSDDTFAFSDISINEVIELQENESICIVLKASGNPYRNLTAIVEGDDITFNISKVDSEIIDFDSALINFKIKDFFNEVLFRYGLTPYKDKYTNNYDFKTMQELLQTAEIVDWSASEGKFSEKVSESYVYGSYAQQNVFKHKYNDSNDDYFDGNIPIDNVNLKDSRNAIVSKIYVPEKTPTNVFEKLTNVYKLWDKEPKDDGTTNYKSLSKRFYFMRYEDYYFNTSKTIGSEQLQDETTISTAPFESFFGLSYIDSIQDYYTPIKTILNNSLIVKAKVFLNEIDVINIDFTKLYYIRELGGYFISNKVNNFIEKGLTNVDLIKVDYKGIQRAGNSNIITSVTSRIKDGNKQVLVFYKSDSFINASMDYVLNSDAPISFANDGLLTFNVPINSPLVSYDLYITDGITTSEIVNFTA